jgi:hypothetical protein
MYIHHDLSQFLYYTVTLYNPVVLYIQKFIILKTKLVPFKII